jgi:hypothetical protein
MFRIAELYALLVELKVFRNVVLHQHGFNLAHAKVDENLARVRTAFPAFVKAVAVLERTMTAEKKDEEKPSGSSCAP